MNAELVGEGPIRTSGGRPNQKNEDGGQRRRLFMPPNFAVRHGLWTSATFAAQFRRTANVPKELYARGLRRLRLQTRSPNGTAKKLRPAGADVHPEEPVPARAWSQRR